jgi:hypothetical protein
MFGLASEGQISVTVVFFHHFVFLKVPPSFLEWGCRNVGTHPGDVWRHSQNFREGHKGGSLT